MLPNQRPLLLVIMDGVGVRSTDFGNAVSLARTPNLNFLRRSCPSTTLFAHGTHVGLPDDTDMGNSEVGHNALGAGRIFDQGAKLVKNAIASGSIFAGTAWKTIVSRLNENRGTLHLIGLLSDGNIHSHEQHLFALMRRAKADGIRRVRIHALLDGRDVGARTAEVHIARLNTVLSELNSAEFDAKVASGGGRMTTTMDRYKADWRLVECGWNTHVHGMAELSFPSIDSAIASFRTDPTLTDQYLPPFVIVDKGKAIGAMEDGDAVVLFNFRGDRAIEICEAFSDTNFSEFSRGRVPAVFFAGMMQYDGDLHIPEHYLVEPPQISNTLGELMADTGIRQLACSETQKYGHVTYFWNGNRSGKFNAATEEYVEITSDILPFDEKPWMKAWEITELATRRMREGSFDFGRINFANGDMVGHTGNLEATIIAIATIDMMLGKLISACRATGTMLLVTADHGNAEEMFDTKDEFGPPGWLDLPQEKLPKPKTSHTLNPVPLSLFDPKGRPWKIHNDPTANLGNVANTVLDLMGQPLSSLFLPSLIERP